MAILEGMLIRSGADEIYILPLSSVVESIKPKAEDIHTINDSGVVLRVRDELLPVIPLYHLFGIEPVSTDITDGIVVIVQTNGKKAALCVDELVGQQQVVVKNLESNYRKVPGVSGATILGNGRVSLILDIPGLLQHHASAITA
jgi:two-component system chemotaxis sensor kinase CheA